MAFLEIQNVSIKGISACVPKQSICNADVYEKKWGGYNNFVATTGIANHRKVSEDTCTSDLCCEAAEKLISDLTWDKSDIEALVFVTQTPDFYNVPATSCLLQNRLGLSASCYTLDISLGCSGWVYGMSVISALVQTGTIKKAILLAGDTPSKAVSENDKSTFPLFGDAGTATALEFNVNAKPIRFAMFTDGSGYEAIMIRQGGYRTPLTPDSFVIKDDGEGKVRSGLNVVMDGESVFTFGISKAPKSIKALSEKYGIDLSTIDLFTFHQANLFMNEKIRKKLKIGEEKVPYSLHDYGNTSSASIPLTLVAERRQKLQEEHVKHIACGFGVGLSWGVMNFETDNIVVPEIIEI